MSIYSLNSLSRFALVAAFVVAFVGRAALTPSIGCGQDGQKADATGAGATAAGAGPRVDFAREVRPILAGHCWSCHGVDETTREAGLRLDQRDAAVAPRTGSSPAIVPGQPAKSLMVARMHDADPERRMPPAEAKKPLTPEQIAILERWIAQGADFAQHWAFTPPRRPLVPDLPRNTVKPGVRPADVAPEDGAATTRDAASRRGTVDAFIVAALQRQGLHASPPATPSTLLRRVALDLTGLPPRLELVAEFEELLAAGAPDAYERIVDRLLASPGYAERMAMNWLDAARYADTNGYNNDEERSMWPWRDWVIEAYRRQLPFDRFVVEQLAGDQLPNATLAQKIATGFNRNHALTTEGGIIEEEYRVEYVADRLHTTATVFLGLSLQCARCHDHKYDPFTQREYYQLFAFFNHLPHQSVGYARGGVAEPSIKAPTRAQELELARLTQRRDELNAAIKAREAAADPLVAAWERSLTPDQKTKLGSLALLLHLPLDENERDAVLDVVDSQRRGQVKGSVKRAEGRRGGALEFDGQNYVDLGPLGAVESDRPFSIAAWVYPQRNEVGALLSKMDDAKAYRGYDVLIESGRISSHLIDHWPDNGLKVVTKSAMSLNQWHQVTVTYDGSKKAAGVKVYVDGKSQELEIANDKLQGTLQTDKPLHLGRRHASTPLVGRLDDVRIYGREVTSDEASRLAAGEEISGLDQLLAVAPEQRTETQREMLRRYYLDTVDGDYKKLRGELAELPKRQTELEKAIPAVMIMQDQPQPRETRVLRRGQYDQLGDVVTASVPSIFAPLAEGQPSNRLSLARWLVDPAQPLTARVAVNRWWESYFGLGLVETLEDFGVTGAFPSHPELLDWLAVELMASGWDTLGMQRRIVTSATYRQSSRVTPELLQRDPKNQWLARGPRFRLSAESVRDNALAVSGLLVEQIGGPSVKPYQPDGLWEDVTVERRYKYQIDPGSGLYRRSMYTFWKRTCPPPTMSTFDAPNRETCTIRRARTNTPLQALVLLNDPTYVEAARVFATRTMREAKSAAPEERLSTAFRLALARAPRPTEREVLLAAYREAFAKFSHTPADAEKLLGVGRAARDDASPVAETAAWTVVCDLILNLDEMITKG